MVRCSCGESLRFDTPTLYSRYVINQPFVRPEVERSLALHREVAERLRRDPELLEAARERVERWLVEGSVHEEWATSWRSVIDAGLEAVIEVLTDIDPASHDLRQVSPFAGVLDPRTRWTILRSCSPRVRRSDRSSRSARIDAGSG